MMNTKREAAALLAATSLSILSSSALAAGASKGDVEIIAVTERWAAAYGEGDLKAIAGMYTDDAKLMPEGSGAISGRDAIGRWLEQALRPALPGTIRFSGYEIYGHGQSASSVSQIEIRDAKGQLQTRAKQILVLLKQHGHWKIHRDIWTSDGPAHP
jgi:uncharacterized protein (TIGR02246 family)